jgi:hypothetical protein
VHIFVLTGIVQLCAQEGKRTGILWEEDCLHLFAFVEQTWKRNRARQQEKFVKIWKSLLIMP